MYLMKHTYYIQMYNSERNSVDDELGYRHIKKPVKAQNGDGIIYNDWSKQMAEEALSLAKQSLWIEEKTAMEIFINRLKFVSDIEEVLKTVTQEAVLARELMGAGLVDYEGWIRIMVHNDDEIEGVDTTSKSPTKEGRGMNLRSQRKYVGYERWITISEEQRRTLKETALRID